MNYEKEIKKISKILNISSPKIIYNPYLAFSYMENIIYYKKLDDEFKMLFLFFHELRHHYQSIYIKNNKTQLSSLWKDEMDNYNIEYYLDYDIEIDAYSFAYLILKYRYNFNYLLSDNIKNIVLKHIQNNMNRYKHLLDLE